jgi:pilus assembly protein Flp/PilA
MVKALRSFLRDEGGATAVEYAVMLALIIIIAIGAISALGTKVSGSFANTAAQIP